MKQFHALFLVAFLACLASLSYPVSAVGLEYYGIEGNINDDMTVTNSITLKFDSPISHMDCPLGFRIYNLSAVSNFDSASCSISDTGGKSTIMCDFLGMTEERNQLKLNFETKEGVNQIDGKHHFSVNYGVSLPIETAFIIIKLPENSILAEQLVNASFTPSDGKTLSDGRRIGVYWERNNLTEGEGMEFSVSYSAPSMISSTLMMALTAVIIAAMVGVGIYIRRGSKLRPSQQIPIITSVLNEDERKVVDILGRHEGRAGQKAIVRETDFSKAKVSRLVKSLKSRGVVEVEPISGRENRIVMKLHNTEPKKQEEAASE